MSGDLSPVHAYLRRPSMVDFGGHLAVVFFVSGCNFRCGFCHNAPLLAQRRAGLPWERLRHGCEHFRRNWVNAAVVSGGEPTLDPGLAELLRFFKGFGWAIKLDTNGSRPDALRACLPLVDYVAMDIKAAPEQYPAVAGFDGLDALRASVDLLRGWGGPYEFRTTVIGSVHDDTHLHAIGAWIRGARRYVVQPFVPRDDLPDEALRHTPRTPPDRMRAVADLMRPYAAEVVLRGG